MPVKILMPALSPTMTEGTLAKWLVGEGDTLNSGDVIAEIETDKATMEVEAVEEGKLGKILVAEGTEGVAVNNVIALLLEEGEDDSALAGVDVSASPSGNGGKPPAAGPTPAPALAAPAPAASPTPQTAPPVAAAASGARVVASPLARRMASQAGLDLANMAGTGPNSRIVKADVEAALSGGGAPASAAAAPSASLAIALFAAPSPFLSLFKFTTCSITTTATITPPAPSPPPSQSTTIHQ